MARIARVVVPGCPHHVTHRGNRGSLTFLDDADRRAYLRLLREQSERFGLRIWAYCLMSNHVHLVVVGLEASSMAQAVGYAHVRYVETNPVRAGVARLAEDYPWSSARAHALGIDDPLLAPERPFPGSIDNWSEWLTAGVDERIAAAIRHSTSTGRPNGSLSFTADIERRLGREIRPKRQRKSRASSRSEPSCGR